MKKSLKHPLSQSSDFKAAIEITKTLVENGFLTYWAGGCLRDALIGRLPKDIDIVTMATPDQVEEIFKNTVAIGKKFGIILVIEYNSEIEVATFRKEDKYFDGRRPEVIEFSDPKEDSARRDFTVNALFYDPIKDEIIDFQNGMVDVENKILRCVGNPKQRFLEDHLRILRLIRFATVLNFKIESDTYQEALVARPGLSKISDERMRDELLKTLEGTQNPWLVVNEFQKSDLWTYYGINYVFDETYKVIFDSYCVVEKEFLLSLLWFSPANFDARKWLNKFKCSQNTLRWVEKALKIKYDWDRILSLSEEDQLYFCHQNYFPSVLERIKNAPFIGDDKKNGGKETLQSNQLNMLDRLKDKMIYYFENPVQPLITGHDLPKTVIGARIGDCLRMIFKKQLKERWKEKDQVLNYLRSHIQDFES